MTYIGMSSKHLITRVREHLNFNSIQESAVKNYVLSCDFCSNVKFDLNNFSLLRKYKSKFHTRIHEALLIRKSSPNFKLSVIFYVIEHHFTYR